MIGVTAPFTPEELAAANREWGCNCGPSALAFALRASLSAARYAIQGFDEKRYTTPSMMKSAVAELGATITPVRKVTIESMFSEWMALVRIQFTGPWTAPGANPRWAYRHTHWVATWTERGVPLMYDANEGITSLSAWEGDTLLRITSRIERADRGWFPTHVWRINSQ